MPDSLNTSNSILFPRLFRSIRRVVFATVCLAAPFAHAGGELATPIAIETLFEHPRYGHAELSPNTKLLAAAARVGDRMRLVVIDLETQKAKPVAGFDDADIAWFTWINDKRLVFNIEDRTAALGEQPGQGLFAVDADGGELRELMPTIKKQARSAAYVGTYRSARFLQRVRGTDDILLLKAESGKKGMYAMRQNTRSRRESSAMLGTSGDIIDAKADSAGDLRAIVAVDREGKMLVWYRSGNEATWEQVAKFASPFETDAWAPVGFSADGKAMWVTGSLKRDLGGIYPFDLATRRLGELTISHPSVDVAEGLQFDPENGELLGVTVEADKPQANWFDAEWARAQSSIDTALPGRVNRLSGNARTRLLVFSYSDRDPGRYYLYDVAKRSLAEQLALRPNVDPSRMAETKLIYYEARDKLRIPAYLTLPTKDATKVPLVVLPHGGPYFIRDSWRFSPEVQFLASRGYAVLQPQFRGSTGFGDKLFRAGWKTWGLAMQDDLTDGIRALVEQGKVDANRVCVMGASYGGYAALMGLVKDPDLYRCGIDFAGVSDIRLLFSISWSDFANSLWAEFYMKDLIGDPDLLASQFVATSPVEQAAKIRAPLLLAYATDDYRVPIAHGNKMRDALTAAGKSYEWHSFSGEGHGLMKLESRVAFYRSVENFLARNLNTTPVDAAAR